MHNHTHSKNQDVVKRINIILGHLQKVKNMTEEGRYCIDILHQSLAVQKALRQVDVLLLDTHLQTCVKDAFQGSGKDRASAMKELVEVYKHTNR